MENITVSLGNRSYPITIDAGLFQHSHAFSLFKEHDKALIVTNNTLAPLYLSYIQVSLTQLGVQVDSLILPDGEQYKKMSSLEEIYTHLLTHGHDRTTTLVALGGGVIGDLTGFAAATYQRGVRFIQVPTSLLAQVDSSVGGKTGINHPLGKNMIGSFYQPAAVIIDINCLTTLPQREFISGLAEVIKYSLILDKDFFYWLETHLEKLLALELNALAYCIRRCCEIKAKIVALDEQEHGIRALLNLGHTYGHAIETATGYGTWLHGEAVAVGIMMASHCAYQLALLSFNELQRIERLLLRAKLPVKGPKEMSPESYLPYMLRDKKVIDGNIRLVLPTAIGQAEVKSIIEQSIILTSIGACQ